MKVDANGSAERLVVDASYDLDWLAQQLGQFVDFGALRPSGKGSSQLTWTVAPPSGFHLTSQTQLHQWRMPGFNGRVWQEDDLALSFDATGAIDGQVLRVGAASGTLRLGPENADFSLLEPIADLRAAHGGALHMHLTGDLARWHARLKPWTTALDGVNMSGQADLSLRARPSLQMVELDDVQLNARNAGFVGLGLNVQEPTLTLHTSGRLTLAPISLDLKATDIVCPSLTLQSQGVNGVLNAKGEPEMRGSATVQGDLGRLQHWWSAPGTPEALYGRMAGTVTMVPADGKLVLQTDVTLSDFIYGSPAAPTWREPTTQVVGQIRYDGPSDSVRFEQVKLTTSAFLAEASGQIVKLSSSMDASVTGTLHYDVHQLEPALKFYLGQGAKIEGHDSRPFQLTGSLASPPTVAVQVGQPAQVASVLSNLTGRAGVSWKSAQAYGCNLGPGEVKLVLYKGWIRVDPIEASLNGGRLHAAPYARLEPGPMELYLPKGTNVDRFQLTRATCASAMGYALPALANALEADGQVSLQIDAGQVPLAQPTAANIAGRLIIHNSRIAGSPMIQELATLLRAPTQATLGAEAVVPLRFVNGRVYHRDLKLIFPELTITTQGSVGLDGSLDLLAEMPVPPKWLAGKSLGSASIKPVVRLPIRGTLSSPKIDAHALQQAMAQVVRDTAGDVLRHELDKKLNNLLQPKK
jgi:hypothetical protein